MTVCRGGIEAMVARPGRCSGAATDGLSVERGSSVHLKWLLLQLVWLARVLLVRLWWYGQEAASCFCAACSCELRGGGHVGAAWGQGASKTQLRDLQSGALPLRHGPDEQPPQKGS
jgi:hypothetical protein